MIECKDCGLPTMPAVLFWEGISGARLPCLCGCMARVRDVGAQIVDLDVLDDIRASGEGMPEKGFRVPLAPLQAWKDFIAEEMRQSHDFSHWMMPRDRRMPMPANKEGVMVGEVFRRVQLRKAFHSQSEVQKPAQAQEPVLKEVVVQADHYNPYMSGMEILAKYF